MHWSAKNLVPSCVNARFRPAHLSVAHEVHHLHAGDVLNLNPAVLNLPGDQSKLVVLITVCEGLPNTENAVANHLIQLHFHKRISQGKLAVHEVHHLYAGDVLELNPAVLDLTSDQSELAVLITACEGLPNTENAVANHIVQLHFHIVHEVHLLHAGDVLQLNPAALNLTGDQSALAVLITACEGLPNIRNVCKMGFCWVLWPLVGSSVDIAVVLESKVT